MMGYINKSLKLSALCIAMVCIHSHAFALENLEKLDDYELADATGEGIAILPTEAFMVFRGAGPNEATTTVLNNRLNDTGHIRFIPVGPLTSQSAAAGAGKADIFLYGLAISKGDDNLNNRIADTVAKASIASWGTPLNPWLFKVDTENVPNFNTSNTGTYPVTYLSLEAPLYQPTVDGVNGQDAYNLKLGMWADAFVRDPGKAENDAAQFCLNGCNRNTSLTNTTQIPRENRLRLQAIWDGFSINGSQVRMFQTLNGVGDTGDNGINQGMSRFYNNTLGISALVRLNSGDTRDLKATLTDNTVGTTSAVSAWQTIHNGTTTGFNGAGTSCNNTGTGSFSTDAGCRYIVQNRTRTDSKTRTRTWDMPANLNVGVLRLSTRESATSPLLDTPALNSSLSAPTFDANEGLFLYGANINLVLGSLYQPLTIGSDGTNFSLEIARIPNKEAIYKQIYTNYNNLNPATNGGYYGSTCSIYGCSNTGKTATHSSISIGTTNYNATTGLMTAYSGAEAIGVSFGTLQSNSLSASTTAVLKEVQYKQRQQSDRTWVQSYSCSTFGGCGATTTGHLYEWSYNTGNGYTIWNPSTLPGNATCSPNFFGNCSGTSGSTPIYGTSTNRNWTATTSPAAWLNTSNAEVDALIGSAINGSTGVTFPTNGAANPTVNLPTPSNNFGSAVIDGLLIQHMKITTKGL